MTEEKYKLLCRTCDSVLQARDATLEAVAIPWLHVMREHPIFLSQYEGLFTNPSLRKLLNNIISNTLKEIYQWIKLIINLLHFKKNYWIGDLKKKEKFDVIFISHLLNASQLSAEEDFYFNKLPHEIVRHGHKALIVLINQTSISDKTLNKNSKKLIVPRVVISEYLPLNEEFRIWWRTKKQENHFRQCSKIERKELRRKVLSRAVRESTSFATKKNLRIAGAIKKIITQTQAKSIITTYEGHAWERIVYASARSIKKDIKCIGYQHAALFRLQHAAKRSIGPLYDPELILTAGTIGLNQMKGSEYLSGVNFDILGSSRYLAVPQNILRQTCLVLPEGILKESQILFSFSLKCAISNPQIHFIWRLHPIINLSDLVKLGFDIKNIPSNVEISTQSFEKDIARSKWALYRGSTASISAGANGVIPIYLSIASELPIDPLYEMKKNHPTIDSIDQFGSVIEAEIPNPKLVDYCIQYYRPFNTSVLAHFIKNI